VGNLSGCCDVNPGLFLFLHSNHFRHRMHLYLIILRILHITFGVFWAGTAFLMVLFIFPAVKKAGPDGGKILQAITGTNRFPQALAFVAAVTVITGFLLMWQLSNGFTPEWFESKYGMSLGTGGIAATIAFLQVILINIPSFNRGGAIMKNVAASGGVPSEEQRQELMVIRNRVILSTKLIAFWLALAVITMAGARYF
jgi:hypothetical protein